jgi:hypothetical protein
VLFLLAWYGGQQSEAVPVPSSVSQSQLDVFEVLQVGCVLYTFCEYIMTVHSSVDLPTLHAPNFSYINYIVFVASSMCFHSHCAAPHCAIRSCNPLVSACSANRRSGSARASPIKAEATIPSEIVVLYYFDIDRLKPTTTD